MTMSVNDAKIAIGMLLRGDKQHDVAAWFGENQARIVEAEQGKYGTKEAAPQDQLPPKGSPGVKGRRVMGHVQNALAALEAGDTARAVEQLKAAQERWGRHE